MLRRIFATVLIVLGLAIAGAGIASGTIWRADEEVTATLPQDPEVPVVVAGGNVLATVNPNVTVTVNGPDADTPLVLAMGREADVRAWLDGSPYEEVTGLTDWETLAVEQSTESTDEEPTEDASGSAEPTEDATDDDGEEAPADATVPNPVGSDLWIEEVTGTGELTYDWSQVDGRWMMLVATDGTEPAPTVSMTWTREVSTPLMVPGMIVGGVIFLIGLVWLIIELLVRREERRAKRRTADEDAAAPAVATTDEDGTPLTRRQIREAARAAGKSGSAATATTATSDAAAGQSARTPEDTGGAESESDWTAIIGGVPGQEPRSGTETSGPADAEGETTATQPPVSGASDLDDWVRSGRTGSDAGPVSTYESPAPGRGIGAEHAPAPGMTWRGAETDANGGDPESEGRPRRWWQRRAKNEAAAGTGRSAAAPSGSEHPATAPPDSEGPVAGSAADLAGPSTGGAEDASESNPQASGASWRETWGLTTDTPQDAERPAEPDQDVADDQGEDEEVDR